MRHVIRQHSLNNPFHNRFNDPVTRRHDDMQSSEYTIWLRERNLAASGVVKLESSNNASAVTNTRGGRIFAGAFALLLVLVSVAVLLKAF